ncbi:hypothetical protein [Caulobacter sp. 17J65-9]|uniref:hypothetical protein n=1 Tax=Caulobacter sp. 17J65-9 TaxID=2709382 RepID=UPI0013C7AFA9|nr:hypothetical protein [Caulobacter sp. 17J65-9]NEX94017.1 hypothetical protein [Caulobacter sp. 17J65-9]
MSLLFFAIVGVLVAHAVVGLTMYQRWRKVRFLNAEGLTINRSLLRAVENNQESLGARMGWPNRDNQVAWNIFRLTWTGEHRIHKDAELTRLVHVMRVLSLLALPAWLAVILGIVGS